MNISRDRQRRSHHHHPPIIERFHIVDCQPCSRHTASFPFSTTYMDFDSREPGLLRGWVTLPRRRGSFQLHVRSPDCGKSSDFRGRRMNSRRFHGLGSTPLLVASSSPSSRAKFLSSLESASRLDRRPPPSYRSRAFDSCGSAFLPIAFRGPQCRLIDTPTRSGSCGSVNPSLRQAGVSHYVATEHLASLEARSLFFLAERAQVQVQDRRRRRPTPDNSSSCGASGFGSGTDSIRSAQEASFADSCANQARQNPAVLLEMQPANFSGSVTTDRSSVVKPQTTRHTALVPNWIHRPQVHT